MEYVAEAVHQIIHIATLIAFKNCAELGGGAVKKCLLFITIFET